ncbi:MAG: XdhC family protein, partial [Elusimicrobia bacterium]|nr:XdhC family protein [Elusimicrobiota bacterium]
MVDFEQLKELKERKEPFAVATVIRSEGSSPSKVGSSMIVFADGKSRGTVGGGEVEKDAIEQAKLLIKKGKSATVSFNLGGGKRGSDFATEMVCGGNVEIFFDVWKPPLRLVVFGAGHIGKKLAEISKVL